MNKGSCLCGSIKFTLDGKLQSARFCHCENCTKFSGTSPATWAMANSSELELANADVAVTKFNSGRGLRCFCSACGSPVWFESLDYPEIVAIPLGVLDGNEIPTMEMHLWTQSMSPWCTVTDGLPQHNANPDPD